MSLSAKTNWIVLRATAIAAIPLCIWLVLNIVGLIGAPYEVFTAWLQNSVNAVLLILFVIVIFYHALLGTYEILEDYVHNQSFLKFSIAAKTLSFLILGAACIVSILKVALT